MTLRGGVLACCTVFAVLANGVPGTLAGAAGSSGSVVIRGVGAAHGFGMAMDGVAGQARAGWSHDRILSLFYPGTETGRADGTIRVGLADEPSAKLTFPGGGTLSDAAPGGQPGGGFPLTLPAGAEISLSVAGGGIRIDGAPPAARPAPATEAAQEPPDDLLPTPPPILEPTPTPSPEEGPEVVPPAVDDDAAAPLHSVWVWGAGDPALVGVASTGRRYRGSIQATIRRDNLTVVNHVDLETYVAGIAEEKGQGWPIEGLKALAVAARSLGAATTSWYTKNRANGYDICPTGDCQLYLGYDGEEPAMRRAVAETAGQIRTFSGRPILAMYHGNGGGQTESYAKVIDNGTDPHPYLRSVRYPHARPSRWTEELTYAEIAERLRAADIAVPAGLERIEVAARGESPRVVSLELAASSGGTTVPGARFAGALGLRSTWFDIDPPGSARVSVAIDPLPDGAAHETGRGLPAPAGSPWAAVLAAVSASVVLAAGARLRRSHPPR